MDEVLTFTLQGAVFGRLDYLERLANEGDQQSKAALADSEIARLTGAFRALLADHVPDERAAAAPAARRGGAAGCGAPSGTPPTAIS
jgi:hypothetical protein